MNNTMTLPPSHKLSNIKARIEANITPEPNTGCWLWTGASCLGYGTLFVRNKRTRAHRAVWELHRGPIPAGMFIDHMCRVKSCVNPDHLRVVTKKTNNLENHSGAPARNARKTHCLRGHPFAGANLRIRKNGDRTCIACIAIHNLALTERRRVQAQRIREGVST